MKKWIVPLSLMVGIISGCGGGGGSSGQQEPAGEPAEGGEAFLLGTDAHGASGDGGIATGGDVGSATVGAVNVAGEAVVVTTGQEWTEDEFVEPTSQPQAAGFRVEFAGDGTEMGRLYETERGPALVLPVDPSGTHLLDTITPGQIYKDVVEVVTPVVIDVAYLPDPAPVGGDADDRPVGTGGFIPGVGPGIVPYWGGYTTTANPEPVSAVLSFAGLLAIGFTVTRRR